MSDETPKSLSFAEKLQAVPKRALFLILFFAAAVPLFFPITLPNEPVEPSIDFYTDIMNLKPGDKILLGSDWTLSTRGESGGEMDAILRILIRRGIKFAVYATADPQAPQVARDEIAQIAKEEAAHGQPMYRPFTDYVITGYFANSEGTTLAINNNVRKAFAGRKDHAPGEEPRDVLLSPVFQGIKSVSDFKYLVLVTASNTEKITIQRVKKAPLLYMVTGVMVPEDQTYFASGQLKGLCGGVKGVFDLETLMESGINTDDPKTTKVPGHATVPGFPGMTNKGHGTAYYPALHVCLLLMIFFVIVGNVGMLLQKRGAGK